MTPQPDPYDDGMRIRREVLGDAHVDRAESSKTPFTSDFQGLITRYAWGSVWARPGLDRRARSIAVLTIMLCAAGVAGAMALTWLLAHHSVAAWPVLPACVAALLGASVLRRARSAR